MRKIKTWVILAGCFFLLLWFIYYYLVHTSSGSKLVADKLISSYADNGGLAYTDMDGTLIDGITFQDLEIMDIGNLPTGTVLKIKRLFLNLTALSLSGLYIEIENARLKLPDSDPVVISGTLKGEDLDLNIFSNGFTVTEILSYLPDFKKLIPIKGDVSNIDLFVTGNYLEPAVKGHFDVEKFVYKGFVLSDAPIRVDIQLKDVKDDVKLYGNLHLDKGELKTRKVLVKLAAGDLNFSGLWNQPYIAVKGQSKVEKTKIDIVLTGTVEKPSLQLSSDPPHSREKLMVMLATGKSWKSVEDSVDNGLNSAALTKDFVDYFLFSSQSSQFAKRFGISDFSVEFGQNRKGIAAKKEVSEKLEVGYGIEQQTMEQQEITTKQKVQGEYQLTDKVSVGVEKEVKKTQSLDELDPQQEKVADDKVYLKYKKRF